MQKKIILFVTILFLLSSAWLFWAGEKATDPNNGKNFWVVYFSDPKSDSLDFIIENHSNQTDFRYEIFKDKEKIKEGEVKIEKGILESLSVGDGFEKAKFTVRVGSNGESKEIYKIFDK